LLLHRGVQKQYAEHTNCENEGEARGKSRFTTAR
jgi:hypothetical protein